MTDEDKTPKSPIINYSANSNKSKKAEPPKKDVKQVVNGGVIERKPGIGRKFRDAFAGDDAQTVGQYLLLDVVVPQTKNLIFDLGREFLSRMLFGTSAPRSSSSSSLIGKTNYSSIYKQASSPERPTLSAHARSTHNFSEIILDNRGEAEEVISALMTLIEDYGSASVADLYACVGVTSQFTDNKFGWTNLNTASVRHVREGWLVDLPRTEVLN